jgi:DUF1009 family protein
MSAPAANAAAAPLAIICGGGSLPIAVAKAVSGRGRSVVLFPIVGAVPPEAVAGYPHAFIAIGQLGRLTRLARKFGCRDLVMIGTVLRPAVRQIRLDWATFRELPRILAMFRGGDDHLLTMLGRLFEDHGFRLLGAHEVAPEILVPAGPLGRHQPSERDQADISRGLAALAAMGPFDIGQGVVVADGHVLAVEAAEGTDGMVERVAALRGAGRIRLPAGRGVLVKAPKPGQDLRFDLPSIGPRTVESARRAGLAGIAVAAGATIIAEPQAVAAAADAAGLFVQGVGDEAAKPTEPT